MTHTCFYTSTGLALGLRLAWGSDAPQAQQESNVIDEVDRVRVSQSKSVTVCFFVALLSTAKEVEILYVSWSRD